MGAGFSMALAVRLLVRFTDNPTAQIAAACVALIAVALICYGVGQFAVSKGRSAAWGFTGFVGYLQGRLRRTRAFLEGERCVSMES